MAPRAIVLVILAAAFPARAEGPAGPSELGRHTIARGGELIVVPVRIAGHDYTFAVDTGCSHTLCDPSLPLGLPAEITTAKTPGGDVDVFLHEAPEAYVGDLPLRGPGVTVVAAHDFRKIREVTGLPVMGMLGMDFLGRYVVQIDRDHGLLRFLAELPPGSGEAQPMMRPEGRVPTVAAVVGDSGPIQFEIDTGYEGGAGGLGVDDGRRLLDEKRVHVVGSGKTMTAAGTATWKYVQAERLTLGPFRLDRPNFSQNGYGANRLGLGVWSRFVVTFDFPGSKLYLRKGSGFDRPDVLDRSGLHLLNRGGQVVVESVDEGRPGAAADVRPGDVVESIAGRPVAGRGMYELRALLCEAGRIECRLRRDSREHRVMLDLRR